MTPAPESVLLRLGDGAIAVVGGLGEGVICLIYHALKVHF